MASAFFDSLIASWGEHPPKISDYKRYDYLYQILVSSRHKFKIFFDILGPVCKLQTKIQINSIFGNATSRHANSSKLCNIVHPDVRNKSLIFQIDIPKIGYLTEQSIHASRMFFSVTEIERFGA